MKDKKKEFEDSFSGYHADAPAFLRRESVKLKTPHSKALNKKKELTISKEDLAKRMGINFHRM